MSFISDLDKAIGLSKKNNLPLLIYRYDEKDLNWAKSNNYTSSQLILDSIFNDVKVIKKLQEKYILHKFNIRNLELEHDAFYDQFRYYYTPNIIILNSDLSVISFIPLIIFDGKKDIIELINNTIEEQKEKIQRIRYLNNSYKTASISNSELHELIVLENEFSLKTKDKIEKYCHNNGPLTYELVDISQAQNFTSFDFFTEYIMNAPHPEADLLRTGYLNRLIEVAKYKTKDKVEFENCMAMKLKIGEKSGLENMKVVEEFPKNALKFNLEIDNFIEYFEFYVEIIDTINIKKYGELIAEELISRFDSSKKKFLQEQDSLFNWMFREKSIEIGDSIVQLDLNEIAKKSENNYNKKTVLLLNSICWQYAINIKDQEAINKAISWAEFGLTINSSSYLLDTYAHLLYKIGKKNKAIENQKQALLKGELENIGKKTLENMKSFLKNMESE